MDSLGADDKDFLLQEMSVVQRARHSPLMLADMSGGSESKASLKAALEKKGNLAGTRERMT